MAHPTSLFTQRFEPVQRFYYETVQPGYERLKTNAIDFAERHPTALKVVVKSGFILAGGFYSIAQYNLHTYHPLTLLVAGLGTGLVAGVVGGIEYARGTAEPTQNPQTADSAAAEQPSINASNPHSARVLDASSDVSRLASQYLTSSTTSQLPFSTLMPIRPLYTFHDTGNLRHRNRSLSAAVSSDIPAQPTSSTATASDRSSLPSLMPGSPDRAAVAVNARLEHLACESTEAPSQEQTGPAPMDLQTDLASSPDDPAFPVPTDSFFSRKPKGADESTPSAAESPASTED